MHKKRRVFFFFTFPSVFIIHEIKMKHRLHEVDIWYISKFYHLWVERVTMKYWSIVLQIVSYILEYLWETAIRYFMTPLVYRKNKNGFFILCGLEGWLFLLYIFNKLIAIYKGIYSSVWLQKGSCESCFSFAFRLFGGKGHFLFNHAVIIYIQSVCSHIAITTIKGNHCK